MSIEQVLLEMMRGSSSYLVYAAVWHKPEELHRHTGQKILSNGIVLQAMQALMALLILKANV